MSNLKGQLKPIDPEIYNSNVQDDVNNSFEDSLRCRDVDAAKFANEDYLCFTRLPI